MKRIQEMVAARASELSFANKLEQVKVGLVESGFTQYPKTPNVYDLLTPMGLGVTVVVTLPTHAGANIIKVETDWKNCNGNWSMGDAYAGLAISIHESMEVITLALVNHIETALANCEYLES